MATNIQVAGIVTAQINGINFQVTAGSYDVTNITQTEVMTLSGPAGLKKAKDVVPFIKLTIQGNSGITPSMFIGLNQATVQVVAGDGKLIVGSGMYVRGTVTTDAEANTFELDFGCLGTVRVQTVS